MAAGCGCDSVLVCYDACDDANALLLVLMLRSHRPDDGGQWEYSELVVKLLHLYRKRFPDLFALLEQYPEEKFYDVKGVHAVVSAAVSAASSSLLGLHGAGRYADRVPSGVPLQTSPASATPWCMLLLLEPHRARP